MSDISTSNIVADANLVSGGGSSAGAEGDTSGFVNAFEGGYDGDILGGLSAEAAFLSDRNHVVPDNTDENVLDGAAASGGEAKAEPAATEEKPAGEGAPPTDAGKPAEPSEAEKRIQAELAELRALVEPLKEKAATADRYAAELKRLDEEGLKSDEDLKWARVEQQDETWLVTERAREVQDALMKEYDLSSDDPILTKMINDQIALDRVTLQNLRKTERAQAAEKLTEAERAEQAQREEQTRFVESLRGESKRAVDSLVADSPLLKREFSFTQTDGSTDKLSVGTLAELLVMQSVAAAPADQRATVAAGAAREIASYFTNLREQIAREAIEDYIKTGDKNGIGRLPPNVNNSGGSTPAQNDSMPGGWGSFKSGADFLRSEIDILAAPSSNGTRG